MDEQLPGGADQGAVLVDGTVRRRSGRWTPAVQDILTHLESKGFAGVPRPHGFVGLGREVLMFIDGGTVEARRPWPEWTHSDRAHEQVGAWLRGYHQAVADYVPPVVPTVRSSYVATWTCPG